MQISTEDGLFEVIAGPTRITYKRKGNRIGISLLLTDTASLGQGFAKQAMAAFLACCDSQGVDVYLTPVATESHVSKSRLRSFYASLGFGRNTEREKQYWASESVEGHYAMRRITVDKKLKRSPSPGM